MSTVNREPEMVLHRLRTGLLVENEDLVAVIEKLLDEVDRLERVDSHLYLENLRLKRMLGGGDANDTDDDDEALEEHQEGGAS